jgi:hypothetical protein
MFRVDPLLDNGQETTPLLGQQQLGKYVLAAMNMHATEERCFLCGPCRGVILKTVGVTSSVVSFDTVLHGRQ